MKYFLSFCFFLSFHLAFSQVEGYIHPSQVGLFGAGVGDFLRAGASGGQWESAASLQGSLLLPNGTQDYTLWYNSGAWQQNANLRNNSAGLVGIGTMVTSYSGTKLTLQGGIEMRLMPKIHSYVIGTDAHFGFNESSGAPGFYYNLTTDAGAVKRSTTGPAFGIEFGRGSGAAISFFGLPTGSRTVGETLAFNDGAEQAFMKASGLFVFGPNITDAEFYPNERVNIQGGLRVRDYIYLQGSIRAAGDSEGLLNYVFTSRGPGLSPLWISPATAVINGGGITGLTAGAGISISGSAPTLTVTNTDPDQSVTNEIQTLSLSGNNLSISSGNTVALPLELPAGTQDFTMWYNSGAWQQNGNLRNNTAGLVGVGTMVTSSSNTKLTIQGGIEMRLSPKIFSYALGANAHFGFNESSGAPGFYYNLTTDAGAVKRSATGPAFGIEFGRGSGAAISFFGLPTGSRTVGEILAFNDGAEQAFMKPSGLFVFGPNITDAEFYPNERVNIQGGLRVRDYIYLQGSIRAAGDSEGLLNYVFTSRGPGLSPLWISPETAVINGGGITGLTAGAGISILGSAPTLTVTNTDPDQSVTNEIQSLGLAGQALTITGGGLGVNLPVINIAAGSGMSVSNISGTYTVNNTGDTNANNDINNTQDDGVGMTQRNTLNLVSTSTINMALTDNAGFGTTEIRANIPAGGVGTTEIAADAVTSAKIPPGAVTGFDIANNTVTSTNLNTTGVSSGTYGSATQSAVITVGTDGRIISASNSTINAPNIYNANGTLTGDRTMTMGDNTLTLSKTSASSTPTTALIIDGATEASFGNRFLEYRDNGTMRFRMSGNSVNISMSSTTRPVELSGSTYSRLLSGSAYIQAEVGGGIAINQLSADPSGPANGTFWYNTTTHKYKDRVNGATKIRANVEDDFVGSALSIRTGTHTLSGQEFSVIYDANGGAFTVTLGSGLMEGYVYFIKCRRNGTNAITFNAEGGYVFEIDQISTLAPTSLVVGAAGTGVQAPHKVYSVKRNGTNIFIK